MCIRDRNISQNEINKKIEYVLDQVGMTGFEKRPVHTLSGGQKQRINIQLTYPWALGDVNCFYRLNKDTTWNVTNLISSGNNYTANIPSQPAGTIIAYYLSMEDIYGIEYAT